MAHNVVTLRDERGLEYKVEVDVNGSVTMNGHTMRVLPAHRGEVRVDERTVWSPQRRRALDFHDGPAQILELVMPTSPSERTDSTPSPAREKGHREARCAPMPATVVRSRFAGRSDQAGDAYNPRSPENELPVRATVDGTVKAIRCREGELVQPGEELVELAEGDR